MGEGGSRTPESTSLDLELIPGLSVCLDDLPERLLAAVARHFRPQVVARAPDSAPTVTLTVAAPPTDLGCLEIVATAGPVTISRRGSVLVLAVDGACAWHDADADRAGIDLDGDGGPDLEALASIALTGLFSELAVTRGWLAIHAAAIAAHGHGLLLPGASGSGKTTTFRAAGGAGLGLLSDDLVWIGESSSGFVVRPFERGVPSEPVPPATVPEAPLAAVVCPTIVAHGPSRLLPLDAPEAVETLVAESSFLSASTSGARFRLVVRLAARVPAWRLEAGPHRGDVPPLLEDLLRSAVAR